MKLLRDIRVMPVVLVAIFGLMVLKVAGLVLDGGYVFAEEAPARPAGPSWAQQNFNFPGAGKAVADSKLKADPGDITGSVENKDAKKDEAPKPAAPAAEPSKPDGVVVNLDAPPPVSASERAILERLQSRRQELETRAREVEIRESLLKAAEKRIEAKVEEAKANDAKANADAAAKAEAEAARFKGIVTMYENMKPKDAAKVFDRLEMNVLYQIASQIQPRKMSDILGLMQPEAAERLTVELARRAGGDKSASTDDLPKIEGKMLAPKTN
ncbi:flagellar protein FlbB [Bradyrhizobium viridifuturi]|jgi:flagellar motility protein MotE (MotC chaperone)|uniref:MotE family protein n=2 Tax=Nitrobacteraceae TaxID=41294 RepID=UPI0003964DC9|nr:MULTISPECIES: sulfonate transport system substrate-binding protein [Bradyrhizobium]ERF86205.1 MAG: sulfonate transport system substrate-binding protein [Bradyrhizobium sp. DFCI-1]OYU62409.1 MAG: flagellar protein FlbB [Bradyrhizobium sp. PARBB1]PSO22841.1 flagellar protein FlbB [Bradyrhizobium sp. MOS004]QRI67594.1 flagellar protein FlbB [Bradyrhizobium sp. PSBB068]MBR1018685.1 flagellar protein FlbB [Bradyrhizobium viridifuturi]